MFINRDDVAYRGHRLIIQSLVGDGGGGVRWGGGEALCAFMWMASLTGVQGSMASMKGGGQ